MSKPRQYLAVSDTVVGTQARKIVPECVEFVLSRIIELTFGTEGFEPF
ncbi:MAG: hypothetical protein WCE45_05040 [Sedimentisphaerales bacterium]